MFRRNRGLQASVTVFASLSLLLIASFLLVLLEAARVKGLAAYSRMQRTNAMESVFSRYDRELFEKYGIFLLDGSAGSETLQFSQINADLQSVSQKNLRPVISGIMWDQVQNFYQMDVTEASVTGFLLATDEKGGPFRQMAVDSMKARYPFELAQGLYDRLRSSDQAMTQASQSESAMDQAQENIQAAKEAQAAKKAQAAQEAAGGQQEAQPPALEGTTDQPVENPMDVVKSIKHVDVLTLVMPSGGNLSAKAVRGRQTLEHRQLLQGNEPWKKNGGWYEAVVYQQFLQTQFASYEPGKSGEGALDYELEYIHAGKKSDRENLKCVVQQLLLLREGANFMYLQTDAAKQQEAYSVAAALAAAVCIAPATGLIAQGILAAWAYAESVLDVRTLLAGGKIAWMKTAESWSSSLSGLGSLLAGSARAKEQENGDDYKSYLQKLLWLNSERALNYRAMDLMEFQAEMSGRTIRMDAMLLALRADISHEAKPLFSELVTLQRLHADVWEFSDSAYYSYFSDSERK